MDKTQRTASTKSLLVKGLQWFYLLVSLISLSSLVWYKQIAILEKLELPDIIMFSLVFALVFYCLILSISFFTQNTNLLILSLVLIFFTTIGAAILLFIALPSAKLIFTGNLPACAKNLTLCSVKDGMVVASAMLLSVSIPALLLNILTIVGAVKAIASTD